MRLRPAICAFLPLLLAVPASGELIRLKNGRTIVADRVREVGTRIEYDVGEHTFAIARSAVERIDTGGAQNVTPRPAEPLPPVVAPRRQVEQAQALAARLVREGKVDIAVLAEFEREQPPPYYAAALAVAAQHEMDLGSPEKAREYLARAVDVQPENEVLLSHFAALLLRTGRYSQALRIAERATRAAPGSADAWTLFGYASFQNDNARQAAHAWRRALELREDAQVRELLARAERELKVESDFREQGSAHFSLRYEGSRTPEALRKQVLATLEAQHAELVAELGYSPRENIVVVLYTNQAFFDVTQAPGWSAALNDGRLRIPVEGLTEVTPGLAAVLRHELAHSFIEQASRGRAPQWLHEGIAQMVAGKRTSAYRVRLAELFASGKHLPFQMLEGTFANFSQAQATVAYAQSLAAAEYIRDRYGMSDLARMLQRLGEGMPPEAALRATVREGYADLERALASYLQARQD